MRSVRITAPLNKTRLIEHVATEAGVERHQAATVVTALFDVITQAAASGHNVTVTNFGTFVSRQVRRRKARNPQTGEQVTVPAHQVVRFRPSARLVESVRSRDRKATIRKHPSRRREQQ